MIIMTICTTNITTATSTCFLMTPFLSFISRIATGTILKLAAIGVHSVPHYPQVKAKDPITTGSAPYLRTKGAPIPTVITVIAAKAFPMIMVNTAIPIA